MRPFMGPSSAQWHRLLLVHFPTLFQPLWPPCSFWNRPSMSLPRPLHWLLPLPGKFLILYPCDPPPYLFYICSNVIWSLRASWTTLHLYLHLPLQHFPSFPALFSFLARMSISRFIYFTNLFVFLFPLEYKLQTLGVFVPFIHCGVLSHFHRAFQ